MKEVLSKITEPIPLDTLKNKPPRVGMEFTSTKPTTPVQSVRHGSDRAAGPDEMNKLKDLIKAKVTTPARNASHNDAGGPPEISNSTPPKPPTPPPTPARNASHNDAGGPIPQPPLTKGNINEVPEDVLRKILEE